ncbi:MAG: GTP-binding protein, partial [Planctomycetota bacterium]
MDGLLGKLSRGDRRSLARAMSLADGSSSDSRQLQDRLRSMTGNTPWWGFTGPPGVGKSTLIDALLEMLRKRDRRIGVVAIDPTSPTSDGALLGDRVRMMRHAVDE